MIRFRNQARSSIVKHRGIVLLFIALSAIFYVSAAGMTESDVLTCLNGKETVVSAYIRHYGDYITKDSYPFASVNDNTTIARIVISDWPEELPDTGILYIDEKAHEVPVFCVDTVKEELSVLIVTPDDVEIGQFSVRIGETRAPKAPDLSSETSVRFTEEKPVPEVPEEIPVEETPEPEIQPEPQPEPEEAPVETSVAAQAGNANNIYNFYGPVYVINGNVQGLPAAETQTTAADDPDVLTWANVMGTESPASTSKTKTPRAESRFDLTVNGGYGSMYVTADGVTHVPSDNGFNFGVKGLYRINSIFAAGIGVNFGQYHYDSKGYPGPYTVIDPCLVGGARLTLGEKVRLAFCLNAGFDIRMYEQQKGAYPTVFLSAEVTYKINDYIELGLGGSGGFTFQNNEGDAKVTVGGVLRVNL